MPRATIRGKAYWQQDTKDLNGDEVRARGSVESFVALQQAGRRIDRQGVLAFAVGSDGTDSTPYIAKLEPDMIVDPTDNRPIPNDQKRMIVNPQAGRLTDWVAGSA